MPLDSLDQRVRSIWNSLKYACRALIDPETIRAEQNVKMFKEIVSTVGYIQEEERKDIVWQYEMYVKLGLTQEECRQKIIDLIENRSKHLERNELSFILEQLRAGNSSDK